jgi:hypothetical protein
MAMAPGRVTGVLWWEMGLSHYKAVFRRGNSAGYTKDFLQTTHSIESALREMFAATPPFAIAYRWPGGSYAGKIYPGSDRLEIGQWTTGAPGPWRLGDPAQDPLVTLAGNPDAAIPSEADAQWEAMEETEPWLLMVQLNGSQEELHLRAYLGAPPPALARASLDRVPAELRTLMNPRGGLVGDALPPLWFDPDDLRDPWRTAPLKGAEASASASAPPEVPQASPAGSEYRPANEEVSSAAPEPFEVDPDERDRGTEAHAVTQNELAAIAVRRGSTPRSPCKGEPNYDIAWEEGDTLVVVEVKSVTAKNGERQLRLALGQILRYRDLLEARGREVQCAIALSAAAPDPRWRELCERYEVGLAWRPELEPMLSAWLSLRIAPA